MATVFMCPDCEKSKVFFSLVQLEAHIATDHLNLCPYECEKCRFAKFPTENTLVTHFNEEHRVQEFTVKYRYSPENALKQQQLSEKMKNATQWCYPHIPSESLQIHTVDHGMVQTKPLLSSLLFSPTETNQSSSRNSFAMPPMNNVSPFAANNDANLSEKDDEEDSDSTEAPPKKKERISCSLCGDVVSKQRSSMVYHANTRHSKFNLYGCAGCGRKWNTIAKSDVLKHIKSHHQREDGSFDLSMLVDHRKNYAAKLKESTQMCFPNVRKRRF